MARKVTYELDRTLHGGDRFLITDVLDNSTRNLQVEDLAQYFASTGTADPAKVGFIFNVVDNYVSGNPIASGTIRYSGANFANITTIAMSNITSNGVNTIPLTGILLNQRIKLTDVSSASSNAYGFYDVTGVTPVTDGFELTVRHIGNASSEGNLPGTAASITPIGVPTAPAVGANIFDGDQAPSATIPNPSPMNGDLYFRRFMDGTQERFEVYGPFSNAAGVANFGWGTAIDLTGSTGAAGRGITSIVRTSGTGDAGTMDTYTITFTDGTTTTFTITNGADGFSFNPALFTVASDSTTVPGQTTVTVTYDSTTLDTFTITDGTDGVTPVLGVNTDTSVANQVTIQLTSNGTTIGNAFTLRNGTDGVDGFDFIEVEATTQANGDVQVRPVRQRGTDTTTREVGDAFTVQRGLSLAVNRTETNADNPAIPVGVRRIFLRVDDPAVTEDAGFFDVTDGTANTFITSVRSTVDRTVTDDLVAVVGGELQVSLTPHDGHTVEAPSPIFRGRAGTTVTRGTVHPFRTQMTHTGSELTFSLEMGDDHGHFTYDITGASPMATGGLTFNEGTGDEFTITGTNVADVAFTITATATHTSTGLTSQVNLELEVIIAEAPPVPDTITFGVLQGLTAAPDATTNFSSITTSANLADGTELEFLRGTATSYGIIRGDIADDFTASSGAGDFILREDNINRFNFATTDTLTVGADTIYFFELVSSEVSLTIRQI